MAEMTQAEIKAEVKKLKKCLGRVPERSEFGESNWDMLKAQIVVGEENLDNGAIHKRFNPDGYDFGDEFKEADLVLAVVNAALEMRRYMNGDDDPPSEDWEYLAQIQLKPPKTRIL